MSECKYERELTDAAAALQDVIPAGKCKAIGLLEVTAGIAELTAERDSERRRKEHYQRTAYALETTLQACSQRLNCEPDGRVVVELDELLAERDAARAEVKRLRSVVDAIDKWSSNHQTIEAFRLFDDMREKLEKYKPDTQAAARREGNDNGG